MAGEPLGGEEIGEGDGFRGDPRSNVGAKHQIRGSLWVVFNGSGEAAISWWLAVEEINSSSNKQKIFMCLVLDT